MYEMICDQCHIFLYHKEGSEQLQVFSLEGFQQLNIKINTIKLELYNSYLSFQKIESIAAKVRPVTFSNAKTKSVSSKTYQFAPSRRSWAYEATVRIG